MGAALAGLETLALRRASSGSTNLAGSPNKGAVSRSSPGPWFPNPVLKTRTPSPTFEAGHGDEASRGSLLSVHGPLSPFPHPRVDGPPYLHLVTLHLAQLGGHVTRVGRSDSVVWDVGLRDSCVSCRTGPHERGTRGLLAESWAGRGKAQLQKPREAPRVAYTSDLHPEKHRGPCHESALSRLVLAHVVLYFSHPKNPKNSLRYRSTFRNTPAAFAMGTLASQAPSSVPDGGPCDCPSGLSEPIPFGVTWHTFLGLPTRAPRWVTQSPWSPSSGTTCCFLSHAGLPLGRDVTPQAGAGWELAGLSPAPRFEGVWLQASRSTYGNGEKQCYCS